MQRLIGKLSTDVVISQYNPRTQQWEYVMDTGPYWRTFDRAVDAQFTDTLAHYYARQWGVPARHIQVRFKDI